MIAMTGATGHLGNVLARKLVELGERVRVLLLPGEALDSLEALPVEGVVGDVRDEESLVAAFRGCDDVFHLAGIVSILRDQREFLRSVNVEGTRHVVSACLRTGVKRLVYTSSVHAFAELPHGVRIDERVPISPTRAPGEYGKSKALATIEVLEGAKRGLDAVIVCPAGIVGPYDFRESRMGRFLRYLVGRAIPGLPRGAYNFVDVRDVAEGEILAWRKGRAGELYILSGDRITFQGLIEVTRPLVGRSPRYLRLPRWVCRTGAILGEAAYHLTGREPLLTRESLDIIASNCDLCAAKAEREIGYRHRPIAETLRDTVAWLLGGKSLSSSGPP